MMMKHHICKVFSSPDLGRELLRPFFLFSIYFPPIYFPLYIFMPSSDLTNYQLQHYSKISDLKEVWQKFTASSQHPFLDFHFLHSLEITNCLNEQTGWHPHHLALQSETEEMIALMPFYVRMNSFGEYIFDHAWAHAWEQAGGNYYPKLLSAIPFTPITGERFLISPQHQHQATPIKQAFLQGIIKLTKDYQLSSAHINFLPEVDISICEQQNFLIRRDTQFHWVNNHYQDFDDFLNALSNRKRKNIRKERQKIIDGGVEFQALTADEIKASDWDAFYHFYCDTYARKWGVPYLTRAFFDELHARMGNHIVLIMGYKDDQPIAAALNFCDENRLYGRNWGCDIAYPFLHFETCYYQAIDYAIAHKLRYVEAGTQGQHKLDRGYQPVTTFSAHYLNHQGFHDAVKNFISHETALHDATQTAFEEHSPFKQSDKS